MNSGSTADAAAAVEEVVRDSYGRLIAYLASVTRDIAEAEDAFSEALAAALRSWPERGVPKRPDSWLVSVARRNIIGAARHRNVVARALPQIDRIHNGARDNGANSDDATIPDRRLQLMFACAHPAIDPTMHSPLMLQAVLGLDAARIAAAFVVSPATMGQRLVRVKATIKNAAIPFGVPPSSELSDRVRAVLDAIYAAYGSGWDDPAGADPKRAGLTREAIRLARLLTASLSDQPDAHGLLALMLHSDARSAARRSPNGAFVPLDSQDITLWSAETMREAEEHLAIALAQSQPGSYQLQAAIQSVHNRRAMTGRTDWAAISALYDGLVRFEPTLGVHVARAAAWAEAHGPDRALEILDALPTDRTVGYQPYHAVKAHCLQRIGKAAEAHAHAQVAIGLTDDVDVQAYLRHRYSTPA